MEVKEEEKMKNGREGCVICDGREVERRKEGRKNRNKERKKKY